MNGSSYRPTIRSLEINIQWRKVIVHQTWNYRQKHIQVNSSHFCTAHKIKPTIHMQNTNTGEAFFFLKKKKKLKNMPTTAKTEHPRETSNPRAAFLIMQLINSIEERIQWKQHFLIQLCSPKFRKRFLNKNSRKIK